MVYKVHNNGSYNVHMIKTNRFKNIQINVLFRNNIDASRCASRTCLFDMLMESNNVYKTKRDMILKQEELYNSSLYSYSYKLGKQIQDQEVFDNFKTDIQNTLNGFKNDVVQTIETKEDNMLKIIKGKEKKFEKAIQNDEKLIGNEIDNLNEKH